LIKKNKNNIIFLKKFLFKRPNDHVKLFLMDVLLENSPDEMLFRELFEQNPLNVVSEYEQ